MSIPRREVFAAEARAHVENHTEWDSPHAFVTYTWDGEKLLPRTWSCIMPDMDPDKYPALMISMAQEDRRSFPGEPPYAYLIQGEFFGVDVPGPAATDEECALYDAGRLGRTFHKRPDAHEAAIAWLADIHGRGWSALKNRAAPETIVERFYAPGLAPGGQMIAALLACAATTGFLDYGLPTPSG